MEGGGIAMVELHRHQEEAVSRLRNGNILWGGVGTGKSLVAATYYLEREAPRDVYVITTAKKRDSLDWETEFASLGVGGLAIPGRTGALVVDSWNNLRRYREVSNAFFVFDEQRVVGSGTWVRDFIRISKQNNWILLSATPGDTWLDYIPVFVANGFYRNRTEFKQEHVEYEPYVKFPKIRRYRNVGRLVRLRRQILVEMPYLGHTTRVINNIEVSHDEELLKKVMEKRWNVFEDRPLTGVADLFSVMRRVVNSSPVNSKKPRLEMCRSLMKKHPKLIVFYNFDYELEDLRSLVSGLTTKEQAGLNQGKDEECLVTTVESRKGSTKRQINSITTASDVEHTLTTKNLRGDSTSSMSKQKSGPETVVKEWNGHKHQQIPETDRWVYLVQYAAGAEGWNCTETDAMIFYSLPYSYKYWQQAHGRIDRMNTPYSKLFYYSLVSKSFIDTAISKCLRAKKDFNESVCVKELSAQTGTQ
jgi:hypothetical protein